MSETSPAIRTDHPQGFKPPWGVELLLVLMLSESHIILSNN